MLQLIDYHNTFAWTEDEGTGMWQTESRMTLMFVNASEDDVFCEEHLDNAENEARGALKVVWALTRPKRPGWPGVVGKLTREAIFEWAPPVPKRPGESRTLLAPRVLALDRPVHGSSVRVGQRAAALASESSPHQEVLSPAQRETVSGSSPSTVSMTPVDAESPQRDSDRVAAVAVAGSSLRRTEFAPVGSLVRRQSTTRLQRIASIGAMDEAVTAAFSRPPGVNADSLWSTTVARDCVGTDNTRVFVCGPPGFVSAVCATLGDLGFPKEVIVSM